MRSAVKSLIERTFSFPLRAASSIEAMIDSVVVPGGISRIARVEPSLTSMRARMRTLPLPSS